MQYVWNHRLWPTTRLTTVDGQSVCIINQGKLNTDAGPDFANAAIKIDEQYWYGNIEIHVHASDWYHHQHDKDHAYDSVILHVVAVNDARVCRPNGELIPQIVMPCALDYRDRYLKFVNDSSMGLPCARELPDIPDIIKTDWIQTLAVERLQEKADRIIDLASTCHSGWSEAIYITLARAMGFGTNSEPFEILARTTPLRHLRRHADDLQTLEAILFGQAGMLHTVDLTEDNEHYVRALWRDYAFYKAKFNMRPSPNIQWKMARMRPNNFPHRRIASLALILFNEPGMGLDYSDVKSIDEVVSYFREINSLAFWANHYNFQTRAQGSPRVFSDLSIASIIINVVIPAIYAKGVRYCDEAYCERAIELQNLITGENNRITNLFKAAGLPMPTAIESQAYIQLYKNYCEPRKCLFCRFGHRLLSKRITP